MKIRKRYILLIIIALLPLHKFIHIHDYCFGDEDLVIIFGYAVLFFVVFIVILFNNLYGISMKKELFNRIPLIIGAIYFITLLFLLKYHDVNIFKTQKSIYTIDQKLTQVFLFSDNTFEIKTLNPKFNCYYRGTYQIEENSLHLKFNRKSRSTVKFNTNYNINKGLKTLIPKK